jgi:hypothetical protein
MKGSPVRIWASALQKSPAETRLLVRGVLHRVALLSPARRAVEGELGWIVRTRLINTVGAPAAPASFAHPVTLDALDGKQTTRAAADVGRRWVFPHCRRMGGVRSPRNRPFGQCESGSPLAVRQDLRPTAWGLCRPYSASMGCLDWSKRWARR